MTRICLRLALGASLTILSLSPEAFAGRGGGYSGGGGERSRGGSSGSYGGGAGGGMSHSPSFSEPHSESGGSSSSGRNSSNPNAGAAAAGAGYANKNQSPNHPNAAPAAAGAGYANKNDSPNHPNAAPAAAGAGYSNRNQSNNYSNPGAAAAGAGYANRNQSPYSNAGAAAAGAAYGNNNAYKSGAWNGNYGNASMGAYAGMGMASPSYGYGSTPYANPYAGMMGAVGAGQPGGQGQPSAVAANPSANFNYNQPLNPAASVTPTATDPAISPAVQARQAFQSGDYAGAVQLTQQALGQSPNDVDLHQLLGLSLFAQGSYEQAAAPLYAVLAAGPGWDWTTLIGNYPDASTYTVQLRGLESYVKANPNSAQAQFVEAYQYICQGQGQAAVRPLKAVVALQPNDRVSAQLLEKLQPQPAPSLAQPLDPSKLLGVWTAKAAQNATVTLTMSSDSNFTWTFAAPVEDLVTISGTYALANGVLTLSGKNAPGGPLVGKVASTDDSHMSFKAVGGPSGDPGLQFVR